MDTSQLDANTKASLAYCHKITKKRARNFYYGLKLTPEPKRSAGYTLYAFMRACDDMADEPGCNLSSASTEQQNKQASENIEIFRGHMQYILDRQADPDTKKNSNQNQFPPGEFWPAFDYVQRTYNIKDEYLHAMLDGQQMDLEQNRYETFDELYDYCYKVASVVGLCCIQIWGHDGADQVRQLAEHRGIALQLTNILRDLAEDTQRGRIYLPKEDFEKFNYHQEDLLDGNLDERFDRLVRYEIERAQSYYIMSDPLEPHLDKKCRSTSWAIMKIYRSILDRISENPRAIFEKKISLPPWQKGAIALKAVCKKKFYTP